MDLGLQNVPDDQKVNLGACLLRSALSQWAHNFSQLYLSGAPLPGLDDPGMEQLPRIHPDMPPASKCHCSLLFGMPFLAVLARMFVVTYFRFCLFFFLVGSMSAAELVRGTFTRLG